MPKDLSATKVAQIEGIGSDDWESLSLNSFEAVLAEFAQEFIKEASNNLQNSGAVDTGNLIKSMRFQIYPVNQGLGLSIFIADYYEFVNQGVKGIKDQSKAPNSPFSFKTMAVSKKMMYSIRKWTIRHNLKGSKQNTLFKHRKTKTFKDTSEITAYKIASAIKAYGLKPTSFFDKADATMRPKLAPALAKAGQQDLVTILENLVVKRGTIQ